MMRLNEFLELFSNPYPLNIILKIELLVCKIKGMTLSLAYYYIPNTAQKLTVSFL